MIIMETLILMLFVSALTLQQAYGQDVEIRGTNEKVDGGQTRTIYSQRHLSPHRMMHFGKRPMIIQPPTIIAPQVLDLYKGALTGRNTGTGLQQQQQQQQAASRLRPDYYPYLFSIELENGRTLEAMPEDLSSSVIGQFQVPNKNFYATTIEHQEPEYIIHTNGELQSAKQRLGEQKFLKLLQGDSQSNYNNNKNSGDLNNDNGERTQPSSNAQEDGNQNVQLQTPEQQQQQPQTISLNTRSMQSARSSASLPESYVSNFLYGKQIASSLPNIGSYNKKAEPKGNFFMHFGRK